MLEKTLESPLDCKEIQPVHPKGDQSWILIGRTDAEAETSILWLPDVKNWLIGKHPDAWRDCGQEEKGTTEDEMAGWHHWLDGHEFKWTLGVGDGQGGLACCDSWDHKELDTTEWLNWTESEMVYTASCYQWKARTHKQGASSPLALTLKLYEELPDSAITWTVPCKCLVNHSQLANKKLLRLWITVIRWTDSIMFGRPPLWSKKWSEVKVAQSCLTFCDPMDCSPWNFPGQNIGVGSHSLL